MGHIYISTSILVSKATEEQRNIDYFPIYSNKSLEFTEKPTPIFRL